MTFRSFAEMHLKGKETIRRASSRGTSERNCRYSIERFRAESTTATISERTEITKVTNSER
jgi:hypothetical protein